MSSTAPLARKTHQSSEKCPRRGSGGRDRVPAAASTGTAAPAAALGSGWAEGNDRALTGVSVTVQQNPGRKGHLHRSRPTDATRLTPQDHDKLRAVGFDDTGILQITLIASWFNYINRVADALGVGRGKREDWYPAE